MITTFYNAKIISFEQFVENTKNETDPKRKKVMESVIKAHNSTGLDAHYRFQDTLNCLEIISEYNKSEEGIEYYSVLLGIFKYLYKGDAPEITLEQFINIDDYAKEDSNCILTQDLIDLPSFIFKPTKLGDSYVTDAMNIFIKKQALCPPI